MLRALQFAQERMFLCACPACKPLGIQPTKEGGLPKPKGTQFDKLLIEISKVRESPSSGEGEGQEVEVSSSGSSLLRFSPPRFRLRRSCGMCCDGCGSGGSQVFHGNDKALYAPLFKFIEDHLVDPGTREVDPDKARNFPAAVRHTFHPSPPLPPAPPPEGGSARTLPSSFPRLPHAPTLVRRILSTQLQLEMARVYMVASWRLGPERFAAAANLAPLMLAPQPTHLTNVLPPDTPDAPNPDAQRASRAIGTVPTPVCAAVAHFLHTQWLRWTRRAVSDPGAMLRQAATLCMALQVCRHVADAGTTRRGEGDYRSHQVETQYPPESSNKCQ